MRDHEHDERPLTTFDDSPLNPRARAARTLRIDAVPLAAPYGDPNHHDGIRPSAAVADAH